MKVSRRFTVDRSDPRAARPAPGGVRMAGVLCAVALGELVGAAFSPPVWADDATLPRLTLPEALHRLETETPDALAARLQVAAAEAERVAVRQYQNPTLSADTANLPVGRTTPPGLNVGQTIGSTVRVDQPLILWGKRRLRIDAAEAGVAGAQEQQRDLLRQLRAAVKETFFRAVHDEQRLAFAIENQERYQRTVALSQRRFHSGDISEAEFRKIELEELSYLTNTEEARRALAESEQLLGRLTGVEHPVAANGTLSVPEIGAGNGDMLAIAMQNRPDVAELQRAHEQADLTLRLARRERYPDVTVGLDYTNSQFVIGGNNRNTMGFGFSVPLPVLNQYQGEIAKAEVALRQVDTALATVRLDVAREVSDSVERYRSAQRLLRTFQGGYLERAKLVVSAAEAAYRSGGASLLELLDAERTYTATQTDYLDTLFAARAALTDMEKAVGKDLSTS